MKRTMNSTFKILLIYVLLAFLNKGAAREQADSEMWVGLAEGTGSAREATVVEVASSPVLPEDLLTTLGGSKGDRGTEQRIAASLKKLEKTLILERTRGSEGIAVYRRAAPAVVYVSAGKRAGSGAMLNDKGHVITNWHVVRNEPQAIVVLKPRDAAELKAELAFLATVEKVDQVTDLALLRILNPPKGLTSLLMGDISTMAVGQDVHAIGHPEGEVWTYTKGIVSQIRDKYKWSGGEGIIHEARVIQTQTPINPGNSGGPLLDDSARLIGINSFRSGTGEGLNYAVAVDAVEAFLKMPASRQATAGQGPGVARGKPQCPETYDTKGQGWADILGCYSQAPTPPPDFWAVFRGPKGPLAYAAFYSPTVGQIDRVVIGKDKQWQSFEHYLDLDCNGTIDLIGHQRKGSEEIDSYRVPPGPLRLVTLAKELDSALKARKIPYSSLRICQ